MLLQGHDSFDSVLISASDPITLDATESTPFGKGKLTIVDGKHRIALARRRGDTHVRARVFVNERKVNIFLNYYALVKCKEHFPQGLLRATREQLESYANTLLEKVRYRVRFERIQHGDKDALSVQFECEISPAVRQDLSLVGDLLGFHVQGSLLSEVSVFEQSDFSRVCTLITPDFERISAELIEYFSTHPDDLYDLHPRKFEMLLEAVFRNQGYRTELGAGWSDAGVDLRLYQKDSIGEICTLVQAKRYKPTIPIRLEAVASLVALVDLEKANRGLFVTTSRFLPGVQKFAEKNSRRLTLATSIDIARWCDQVARRTQS